MAPALKKVKLELVKLPGILIKSLNLSETNDNEDARKKSNSNVDIRNVRRGKILRIENIIFHDFLSKNNIFPKDLVRNVLNVIFIELEKFKFCVEIAIVLRPNMKIWTGKI